MRCGEELRSPRTLSFSFSFSRSCLRSATSVDSSGTSFSTPRSSDPVAAAEVELVLFYDVRPEGVSLVNCGAIRMELSSQHNARRTGRQHRN